MRTSRGLSKAPATRGVLVAHLVPQQGVLAEVVAGLALRDLLALHRVGFDGEDPVTGDALLDDGRARVEILIQPGAGNQGGAGCA